MAGRLLGLLIILVLSTILPVPAVEPHAETGAPLASQLSALNESVAMQPAAQQQPTAAFPYGTVAVAILAAGIIGLVLIWYWQGRDRKIMRSSGYLTERPEVMAPALAGLLVRRRPSLDDIVATIVDLARRGALTVTRIEGEGRFRDKTTYLLTCTNNEIPLLSFEQDLLTSLFRWTSSVPLDSLTADFFAYMPSIVGKMYSALNKGGYISPTRTGQMLFRTTAIAISVFVTLLLLLTYSADGNTLASNLGILVFAILAISALTWIVSGFMVRRTAKGTESAAQWLAYREYLRNIENHPDAVNQKNSWDKWLPYTIAFGTERNFVALYEALRAPAPTWYIVSGGAQSQKGEDDPGSIKPGMTEELADFNNGIASPLRMTKLLFLWFLSRRSGRRWWW